MRYRDSRAAKSRGSKVGMIAQTSLIFHCLKTSQAFDIQIHSRALLAAILCWIVICRHHEWLLASGISALGQPCIITSTLPLLLSIHLKLVTVLDYS